MHELRKEAAILLSIPFHNNVVNIVGVCDDPRHYAVVLEFIDGQDLQELLCSTLNLDANLNDWNNKLEMACQITDGMRHLHSQNPPVVHGNLKPRNVLVKKFSANYQYKAGTVTLTACNKLLEFHYVLSDH